MHRLLSWLEARLPKTTITINGKPYLTRCYLFGKDRKWGNIYLHHFHSSDQGEELHNHPWAWGLSVILAGGYWEERTINDEEGAWVWSSDPETPFYIPDHRLNFAAPIERRDIGPGKINLISPKVFHRVDLKDEEKGAWSVFFAGPRTKSWGFLNRQTSEFIDFRKNPEAIP